MEIYHPRQTDSYQPKLLETLCCHLFAPKIDLPIIKLFCFKYQSKTHTEESHEKGKIYHIKRIITNKWTQTYIALCVRFEP